MKVEEGIRVGADQEEEDYESTLSRKEGDCKLLELKTTGDRFNM